MKKFSFYLLSILFLFSCGKDSDVILTETTFPDPAPTTTTTVEGNVTDINGATISNAVVSIYRNGEQEAETMSNEDGFYSFPDVYIGTEMILVEARKADFVRSIQHIQTEDKTEILTKNLQLMQEDMAPGNPTDKVLVVTNVVVDGYVLDTNGDLIDAFVFTMFNDDIYDYTQVDSTGRYELLAPADEEIIVFAFRSDFQTGNWIEAGPLSVNTTLPDILLNPVIVNPPTTINLSGSLQTCNGDPATAGIVTIMYSGPTTAYPVNADGSFSVNFDADLLTVGDTFIIIVSDIENGLTTEEISMVYDGNDIIFGTVTACEVDITSVNVTYFGQTYSYSYGHYANLNGGTLITNTDYENGITFGFNGDQVGTYDASYLALKDQNITKFFAQEPGIDIEVEITSTANNILEGTFQGTFENLISNQVDTVSGDFKLKYY